MELKQFQKNTVDKLLKFINPKYVNNNEIINTLLLKSPTGSGKTIMLLAWINEYILASSDNVAFIWFTPGAGELEEQSKEKAKRLFNINAKNVDEVLVDGFEQGSTTFINYEKVVGKNSKALLNDGERTNLLEKIKTAQLDGRNFIIIVDEAHRNDTDKARNIISKFNALKEVRVSATIDGGSKQSGTEFYEISEEEVIDSGLITQSVIVNEGISMVESSSSELDLLFGAAEKKRKEMLKSYMDNNIITLNPLVLVQLPDESTDDFERKIENYLRTNHNKTYENGKLGIWLSDHKRNIENINVDSNKVEFLIIKQAIATGWDSPRAKILIKLRENMGEQFTVQTIGRIRRMPYVLQNVKKKTDVMSNAYLFTLDSDFLNGALSQGSAVLNSPILNLKNSGKSLRLTSERALKTDELLNEKNILQNLFEGIKEKYQLTSGSDTNEVILQNHGYVFGDKIKSSYKQGRFDTLKNSEYLMDSEYSITADYKENRLDLLHAFHELDRVVHLPVSKIEALLKKFFLRGRYSAKYSLLALGPNEWTAFVLNNWKILRNVFREIDIKIATQGSLNIENIKETEFIIPTDERYKYNPKFSNSVVKTNVYENYTMSMISTRPSLVERLFERWIEDNEDSVEFVYKNGDKGPQYFSLVYTTNGSTSHFYPDYILRTKSGDIYVIETKGGETLNGQDKNIDEYAPAKFESLKTYANHYHIKWAFVRDLNEELFFLNDGEWVDSVAGDEWQPLQKLFK